MQGQSSQTQEQVIKYLQQGKMLLEKNQPAEARQVLEQARDLVPNNVAVRTLLALSHFKLNELERAEEIYLTLIDENPKEASLRSHLAMQYIQQERFLEACGLLEEALEIQPDYPTAYSSLGLVYARLGRFGEARDAFANANQPEMAERMEKKLQEQAEKDAPSELELPEEEEAKEPTLEVDDHTPLSVKVLPGPETTSHSDESADVPFSLSVSVPDSTPGHATPFNKYADEDGAERFWLPTGDELEERATPFLLFEDQRLLIRADRRVYTRLSNLVAISGSPQRHWETKRFQGNSIDQPFGPKENPLARLDGACELFFEKSTDRFRALLPLEEGQTAYFREGAVFAFSEHLSWENGRVPSPLEDIDDLPLDNLWGEGQIVLEYDHRLWGLAARSGRKVRVEYSKLVGWLGTLVPRIITEDTYGPERPTIEFEGEGSIFIAG